MAPSTLILAGFALACVSASAGDSGPWKDKCHDQNDENYGMCTTKTRADLPTVAEEGKFEISFVRRLIAFTDPTELKIAQSAKLWHSGITIKDLENGEAMLVQYEALNFEPNMFYPVVSDSREIVWNSSAVVGWLPSLGPNKWDTTIVVGVVSGTVLNKWFDWVVGWRAKHPHYNLFAVWDRAGMFPTLRTKFEFFRDSTCHQMTEDGLSAFHDLGADFSLMTQPLCRNYAVLIKDSFQPLEVVNKNDEQEWNRVLDFYDGLQKLVGNKLVGSAVEWIKIWTGLVFKYGYTAYLAESDLSDYHSVHLSMPYAVFLLQRMNLPWQTGGNPHECWFEESVAVPQYVRDLHVDEVVVV